MFEFVALFILVSGFIIGLGAVTVIDLHGFLAQKSSYWTVATTRAHKVTKPLIWTGTFLTLIGVVLFYNVFGFPLHFYVQMGTLVLLIINGLFLSFVVSPFLLKKEKEGKDHELLPNSLQLKIKISFIFSFTGWWGSVLTLIHFLTFYA